MFGADIYRVNKKLEDNCRYKETSSGNFTNTNNHDLDWSDHRLTIPIGFRCKYKLKELTFGNNFYPWLQADLGYRIGVTGMDPENRFFYAPAIGLSFDVCEGRHSIDLGLTYEYFKYGDLDDGSVCPSWYQEDINEKAKYANGTLRIGIGYTF